MSALICIIYEIDCKDSIKICITFQIAGIDDRQIQAQSEAYIVNNFAVIWPEISGNSFWPDLKNKSVEGNAGVPLVYCFLMTGKRCNAGISFIIPWNSVNSTEKSGNIMEYRLCVGISPDSEINNF